MADTTYITTDSSHTATVSIPNSSSGSTVTYIIYKASDSSTFASGTASFVAGIVWGVTFTPTSDDTWLILYTYDPSVLALVYVVERISVGGAVPTATTTNTYAVHGDVTGLGAEFTLPTGWSTVDVTLLISEIQEWINEIIRDDYSGAATSTLVCDGLGTPTLFTRKYTELPLISVTSITWRQDASYSWSTTNAWTSTDFVNGKYYISASGSEKSVPRSATKALFVKGLSNYRIIGSFGHSTIPKALKTAVVLLCRERISPGYLNEQNATTVAWEDYRYVTPHTKTKLPQITGFPQVDIILYKYTNRSTYIEVI